MAVLTSLVSALVCLVLVTGAPLENYKESGANSKAAAGERNARAILGNTWFDLFSPGGVEEQLMSRSSADDDATNSPIYYIRLPPNPYMYVPGLGYVSRPDPPQIPVAPPPPPPAPPVRRHSPFIQLPLDFVSNGKPGSTVLTWPSEPAQRPKPTPRPTHTKPSSTVTKLKGPFFFNGKPNGLFILQQDPYSSLYEDVLHNFYP